MNAGVDGSVVADPAFGSVIDTSTWLEPFASVWKSSIRSRVLRQMYAPSAYPRPFHRLAPYDALNSCVSGDFRSGAMNVLASGALKTNGARQRIVRQVEAGREVRGPARPVPAYVKLMSGGLPTGLFAPICASLYRPEYCP